MCCLKKKQHSNSAQYKFSTVYSIVQICAYYSVYVTQTHLLYLSMKTHLFNLCGHVEAYTNSNEPGMLLYTAMTLSSEASLTCQVCCWHYQYQLDNLSNLRKVIFPTCIEQTSGTCWESSKISGYGSL